MSGGWFIPRDWSDIEINLWDNAFADTPAFNDPVAQALFDTGYFKPGEYETLDRAAIRESLASYLDSEYDINFDDIFDWDAWRDAYESM